MLRRVISLFLFRDYSARTAADLLLHLKFPKCPSAVWRVCSLSAAAYFAEVLGCRRMVRLYVRLFHACALNSVSIRFAQKVISIALYIAEAEVNSSRASSCFSARR